MYEAGLSPAEARREETRTLLLWLQAYARRQRRRDIHLLGLRNEVRTFKGLDPIDPFDLTSSDGPDKDEAARLALLRQMDMDDGEPIAKE